MNPGHLLQVDARASASGEAPPGHDGIAQLPEQATTIRRHHIDADPEAVERGLVSLVLTIVELLRQLMERQALRRVDQGTLTDDQVEKVGRTLMSLEERMGELREHFGLSAEDLNLDLGPLGPLLPYE
jgi:Gas vesicle protein K